MASGPRKQVTYAHKRSRTKPSQVVSASSPLQQIEDPDHYMSHAELSRRLLKRARHSFNPEVFSSKRLKSAELTPTALPPESETTSYPPALSEEQKLMLNLSMHPDQISPVPTPRRTAARIASSSLKENFSFRTLKNSKALDTPFNSRPSSVAASPDKTHSTPNLTLLSGRKLSRRTLSDTNYNPNIPQSANTANSPFWIRRPPAPIPLRPDDIISKELKTLENLDFHASLVNPFPLSPRNAIDFKPPPTSISLHGESDSKFFDDMQGSSTPVPKKRSTADAPQEPDLTINQDSAMDVDTGGGIRLRPFPIRARSPWLSDSLISPPASQEWNRPPQQGSYTQSSLPQNSNLVDEISLGLGLELELDSKDPAEEFVSDSPVKEPPREPDLKQMLDGLALAARNRVLNSRTPSLDLLTASAANVKAHLQPARSGMVLGPSIIMQRARSLDERIGEGMHMFEEEGLDDIVSPADPKDQISTTHADSPEQADELDFLSNGSRVMGDSPVLYLLKSKTGLETKTREAVIEDDEEDDELLLKPGFNVWE
ncbi:hypothetical protein C8R43DRAFT_1236070 [Mycena crocata]|nr:hypothetical protein C8R43DRAFT_1236070 [Mycena crocata]